MSKISWCPSECVEAPNIGAVSKTSLPPRDRQIHPIHQPPDLVSLYLDLFWQASNCPIWPQILCQFGPVHLLSPLAIFLKDRSAKLCQNGLPGLSGFTGYFPIHSGYIPTGTTIGLNSLGGSLCSSAVCHIIYFPFCFGTISDVKCHKGAMRVILPSEERSYESIRQQIVLCKLRKQW